MIRLFYSRIFSRSLKFISLLSLLAVFSYSSEAVAQHLVDDESIIVIVAELQGPDPEAYPVTDTFYRWLTTIYSDYDNIEVQRISAIVPFDNIDPFSGDVAGAEIGTEAGADIFFWGAYLSEGLNVPAFLAYHTCGSPNIEAEKTMQLCYYDGDYMLSLDQVVEITSPPDNFRFHAIMALADHYYYFLLDEEALEYLDIALEYIDSVQLTVAAGAYLQRAMVYRNLGELELAFTAIEEAIRLDPIDSNIILALKLQIIDELEAQGSSPVSTGSTGDIPESARECLYLAVMYDQEGDYESAMTMYNAALERARTDGMLSEIYVDRSLCFCLMMDYDFAIADAQRAIEYDPENLMAHARMGEMLYDLGQYSEALTHFDSAVSLAEENSEKDAYVRSARGRCFAALGNIQAGISDLEAVERSGYANPADHEKLGVMYMEIDDYGAAVELLDLAISEQYETHIGYRSRGVCLANLNRDTEAMADVEKALILKPANARTYWALGIVHAIAERYDEALLAYSNAMEFETYPEDIALYCYDRALVLYINGDISSAVTDLNTFLEYYPNAFDGLLLRGVAFLDLGMYENARVDLELCLEMTENDLMRQKIAEALAELPVE